MINNKFIDLSNKTIYNWTFNKYIGNGYWMATCICKKNKKVIGKNVRSGKSKSCGCQRKNGLTHGMTGTRIRSIWWNMKSRCKYKNVDSYHSYGGKGIKVCKKWNKLSGFLEDMKEQYDLHVKLYGEKNTSLDRIDNNQNYNKKNCKWSTLIEQARNISTNRILTFNGQSKTMAEWSEISGIKYATLNSRINLYHWSIREALTQPLKK